MENANTNHGNGIDWLYYLTIKGPANIQKNNQNKLCNVFVLTFYYIKLLFYKFTGTTNYSTLPVNYAVVVLL